MSTPIQDGLRVKQWLDDELMQRVLKTVSANIYAEFRKADSSERRVTAWAKANALEEILVAMNSVVQEGERERIQAERSAPKPKEF